MIIGQKMHSVISYISRKEAKNGKDLQWAWRFGSSEREKDFSLDFRAIRSSKFFGARRKAVLGGETYAWAPIL